MSDALKIRDYHDVLLAPVVSEKSYVLAANDKYTFRVHADAHKTQIRQAVQELFKVKVTKVNTLNVRGKSRRQRTAQVGPHPLGVGPCACGPPS